MLIRLILLVVALSFGVLALLPKGEGVQSAECKIKECERGWENGCVTNEEAAQIDENCKTNSCGMCLTTPKDICYKSHGTCVKTEDGCGWHPSKDLQNCLKMTEAAELLKNHNNFIAQ